METILNLRKRSNEFYNKFYFYIDSCATKHCIPDQELLNSIKYKYSEIVTANGITTNSKVGNFLFQIYCSDSKYINIIHYFISN